MKIKVNPSSSGTGVVTLSTTSGSNTDRTITLPDEDITLGGGVDGIVSTANATAITIDSSENVSIGGTPSSRELTVEHSDSDSIISIVAGTVNNAQLLLGDTDSDNIGRIRYTNADNSMQLYTNGSSKLHITSDGRGLSQFTAKAWVNFNGTGTVSIRDSHNVSSISDQTTGKYHANFSNSLANSSYACMGGHSYNSNYDQNIRVEPDSAGYCHVKCMSDGAYRDPQIAMAIVFGD